MLGCCAVVALIGLDSLGQRSRGAGRRLEPSQTAVAARAAVAAALSDEGSAARQDERPSPPADVPADVAAVVRELSARDESTVAELAALLDPSVDDAIRRGAAKLLAERGTPSAVAALLNALSTPSPESSRDALLAALDSLTTPEAAPALSEFLLQPHEPALVTPIRDALARLADGPGVLEIVTAWHESAAERWQQANLEGALVSVRSPAAVPVLRAILLREDAPILRREAALALGYIGGPDSTDALLSVLATSRTAAVTDAAKESIALLRTRASRGANQPDEPP